MNKFDLFINLDGNCREAVDFYAKVFKSEVKDLMTYGETPPEAGEVPAADRDKIMYACVPFFGCDVMFMDMPEGLPLVKGNQVTPTLITSDKAEMERIFAEISVGGTVDMPLQTTFFSPLYGMVTDKYGVGWQFLWHDGSDS